MLHYHSGFIAPFINLLPSVQHMPCGSVSNQPSLAGVRHHSRVASDGTEGIVYQLRLACTPEGKDLETAAQA
jgi:hypothetical protein